MPSNPTTASTPLLRLIFGTFAGMFAGLFAAVAVGALVGYAGASAETTCMVGLATLTATTVVVAMWIRDRGKVHYTGTADLVAPEAPVDEGYEGIVAALARPQARANVPVGSLFLLGVLLWILVSMSRDHAFGVLLPLATALILLAHEGGHWLAMKLFGYRDARILVVPFLGGLTVGEKDDAPAWQRGIVLLMGPLPGLLGCLALGSLLHMPKGSEAHRVVAMAIFLNGFNLLPLHGLDGGQLVALLTQGRPRLETALRAAIALALVVVSIRLRIYLLVAVGALGLVTLAATHDAARVARRLRRRWPGESPRLADASDAYRRELYAESCQPRSLVPKNNDARLNWMQAVHARVTANELSARGLLLFGGAYAAGLALVVADCVLLAARAKG